MINAEIDNVAKNGKFSKVHLYRTFANIVVHETVIASPITKNTSDQMRCSRRMDSQPYKRVRSGHIGHIVLNLHKRPTGARSCKQEFNLSILFLKFLGYRKTYSCCYSKDDPISRSTLKDTIC